VTTDLRMESEGPSVNDALTLLAEYLEACQHRARVEGDYREGRRIHSLVEAMTAQHMAEDALTTLDPAHLRTLAAAPSPAPDQFIHTKSGKTYTRIGPAKHKALGERWIETVWYQNEAGERFSRETDNFNQSLAPAPAGEE
jgi:rhamnose utilization protein RhaD (predicted bifunctional aldolase and dehydrogenase)